MPKLPIEQALAKAVELIGDREKPAALFFVGGQLLATKSTSEEYEGNLARLAIGLIGVYTRGIDYRDLRGDIAEFY